MARTFWVAVLFLLCLPVAAHQGRTDGFGGHLDSESGLYHYHRPDGATSPWPATPVPPGQWSGPFRVVRVIDGDTLVVSVDGEDVVVRLVGVDAPEKGEPGSQRATEFVEDLVSGEWVSLSTDPKSGPRDRWGRRLAHVRREPDGLYLNLELVRSGLASVLRFDFHGRDLFLAWEDRAKRLASAGSSKHWERRIE